MQILMLWAVESSKLSYSFLCANFKLKIQTIIEKLELNFGFAIQQSYFHVVIDSKKKVSKKT